MINPNFNIGSPTISIKGSNGEWTPIGKIQSMDVEPIESEPVVPKYEGTISLVGSSVNIDGLMAALTEEAPLLEIIVNNYLAKPGAKPIRSRKKRHVKKWRKKNLLVQTYSTYKGCSIRGVEEMWA